ncbi:UDP-N-acetylglucosamine 1-carboxyvinyltransferase [Antricoccus suffuscus]|uniref:UDP-N-acetylglucosamine 1-carboxyvinyltransferase n=1 Tax=Antricoccus suffuscus TaxID=1629062 RepID=A0A2T0ZX55_9ACTN|nr:UDP-N-acetylglucosamine 1-carboxyvinyltransferase [Antricoccus suffuscus]PRZ40668.1 UDP-N-acetylglucosamine 1-carboxyvinyltransferase [Antricoccus suffuscus]
MTTSSSSLHITGGTPLQGHVTVRGAKNLVPKAMVAAILGSSPSVLRNVPNVADVDIVTDLLDLHGVRVKREPGILTLDPSEVDRAEADQINVHAGSSRIPILMCGPLLHRLGHAFIPDLGGCKIGDRPIDFHLDALREMGAEVVKKPEGLYLSAPQRLHGTKIELPFPSVGATEQVLLAAVLAEGKTELRNAATEPEISDLIAVLQKMGALITVQSNRTIRIEGVDELQGYDHWALTDRLEAASWACAALATKGDITVLGAEQGPLLTFLDVFRRVGGKFNINDGGDGSPKSIRFWHPGGDLTAMALETDVAPGFQTDWQQPLVVALTQATGLSIVHERVYENRLGFTHALNKMGAQIQLYRECLGGSTCRFGQRNFLHSAAIAGPTKLNAAELEVPDLRGGFSYLIAALAAEGTSTVHGLDLIYRGYEDFLPKLERLGASFQPA